MKLALVGGGGVRAPLFVGSALRRAERSGLTEICLQDINETKLELFGRISQELARRNQSPVKISMTRDAERALEGANYVVTTVRPGDEEGRIKDERIALSHGVLGQETTGPGGFAMALRSIPVILKYAELLKKVSPDAWLFNFTNPAGLVAQALQDEGYHRTIGICDGANGAQEALARWFKVPQNDVHAEVAGLNHLSFTRSAKINGEEVLQPLLDDDNFLNATSQRMFDTKLIRHQRNWINEYLYYYYYAEKAVAALNADERTRGEEVKDLNKALMATLGTINLETSADEALARYYAYERRRSATYMHYALDNAPSMEEADHLTDAPAQAGHGEEGEGYAGVALNLIDALQTGKPCYSGLNVRNEGAIDGLRADDVVEVSCVVDKSGIRPLKTGAMPEAQFQLVQNVKRYERLAVKAIRERSRDVAVEALMAHPLVLSYSRAVPLVDEYLAAHAQYAGEWK
ncbi:6-phospho-beta-glucosidase [Phyllobacterium myrsinacearum]|uniref:6-phospho-beta-glucosidase n=1 Tax=Phyllobacterium myrsinacearum TaxID=28101 RepID=A0A839EQC0_9HYPH|nr:6-phospho-beta-glucosidase [Phyllobacterium myrsinacearum]MBA8879704.1 6-phospho-beta-glucosidase [Phyllobacterium myrsinacearum]